MATVFKVEPADDHFDAQTRERAERPRLPGTRAAYTTIRIHKDGLMRGTCEAIAIAPSRIFIEADPLSYPVDSRLDIEFVAENNRGSAGYRVPATVCRRSLRGVELKLHPGQPE